MGMNESQSRVISSAFRAHVRGRDGVTPESGVRRAEPGFRGGELEIVRVSSLEEGASGLDVSRRV